MVPDNLVVETHDGNRKKATVLETFNHRGDTFARVAVDPQTRVGSPFEGFVKVPDNPETPKTKLYCEECGHVEEVDGVEQLVDTKDVDFNHRSNAEICKSIHETKTGHSPTLTAQPAR